MRVGFFFIFGIGLAMGYLALIAHSWADGQQDSGRAPAQLSAQPPQPAPAHAANAQK